MLYEEDLRNQQQENAEERTETDVRETKARSGKKKGIGKRILAITLSAALFGTVTAAAFQGVTYAAKKLQGQEDTTAAKLQIADAGPDADARSDADTQPDADVRAGAADGTADGTADAAADTAAHTRLDTASVQEGNTNNSQSLDVSGVAAAVMPAMVSITNVSVQEVRDYLSMFGMGQSYTREVQSSGSGILIGQNDTELLVVTNNHVVEGAETLSVCFVDNSVADASIKGTDEDNDLAVIAVKLEDIPAETMEQIKLAQIGNSEDLVVGQQVVAIGNALGYGQSVTTGIISALNRQIDTTDAALIQTDAAINPGNSGGALLNMDGEVIGINSAKFASTQVEGMGYAISITAVAPIIENLMNRVTREKVPEKQASWLGITGRNVTEDVEEAYGIPVGVYVVEVEDNTCAQQAGLQEGSVITSFDGQTVKSIEELKELLTYYAAGETVELTVMEPDGGSYTEKTLTVTLGSYASYQALQSWEDEVGQETQEDAPEHIFRFN